MNGMRQFRFLSIVILLAFLAGCTDIGPMSVARDKLAYTDAISESWKSQMLLNMVKIRYADAPIFLEVASVINQYSLEGELRGGLGWNTFLPMPSQTVGVAGRYADRPTITYQPLTGEKFNRSLMTPIRPTAVLALVQLGWRADAVLRLCTASINGLDNRVGGKLTARPANPDFYRFLDSFYKIQASRATGMRIEEAKGNKPSSVLFFRKRNVAPEIKAEIDKVRKLLRVDPEKQEFEVVYGALPENKQEIAILSRSMLEILQELGAYIEVPEEHEAEKRVTPNLAVEADLAAGIDPLMHIYSSKEKHESAYISVRYRDHWYWIDDRDYQSKRVFSFLMFLFSLAETGTSVEAPAVTISAN